MSILTFIRDQFAPKKQEQRAITYAQGYEAGLITSANRSGVIVNEVNALGVSAIWCAVKVISESIGSFPLVVYEKQEDGGRERAEEHPLYKVLHDAPNPELTRPVFFETLMSHALLFGTAYAEIVRDNAGNPIALYPIHPQYVTPLRDTTTGELFYQVILPWNTISDPTIQNGKVVLNQADVLAIPGISPDGSAGYSMLRTARDNIGFSIACDRFGQSFFGNMARIGGTLNNPNRLSDEARENLRQSWQQQFGGPDNVGKTAVLEEGTTYAPFQFTNEAGLYTDTRQFQITEVARLFNISPVKLHELGRATWGNLSVLNTDFVTTTLRPWMEKIECEIERKLFVNEDDFYVEFLADSLLRGDTTTRYAAYAVGLSSGFLTVDEVRQFENLPPLPVEAEDNLSDETDEDLIEPSSDSPETPEEQNGTTNPNK